MDKSGISGIGRLVAIAPGAVQSIAFLWPNTFELPPDVRQGVRELKPLDENWAIGIPFVASRIQPERFHSTG
jgi:hypothetical protein